MENTNNKTNTIGTIPMPEMQSNRLPNNKRNILQRYILKKLKKKLKKAKETTGKAREKNKVKLINMISNMQEDIEVTEENGKTTTREDLTKKNYEELIKLTEEIIKEIEKI